MKTFITTFVSALFLFSVSAAAGPQQKENLTQIPPSQEANDQWQQLKKVNPKSEIEWNKQTGSANRISHFLTSPYPGAPEERAKAFMKEHAVLLGMPTDLTDVKHVKSSKTAVEGKTGIDYVTFQQYYDKYPVIGAETILHITESGKVFRVYNQHYPRIEIKNTIKISKEKAIDLVREKTKKEKVLGADHAEVVILPKDGKFYYAWQVQRGKRRFYIDTENGSVLLSQETVLYQTSCTGSVYQENSCDTPNITQENLSNLDTSGFLRGTDFDVQTLSGTRASSGSCAYSYGVSDGRFAQTEVYYQLERARVFFGNLGFNPNPAVTTAYANDPNLPCNAQYDWANNNFDFGVASGGGCDSMACNNPGQDGDVIFHEYTHQVINQVSNIDATQSWPQSIHEGVADYFSNSFFNDSCTGEAFIQNCGSCLRNSSNTKKIPGDVNTDPHMTGLILSGALWDIRKVAGAKTADWIFYEALKGLPSNATFTDFATNAMDVYAARLDNIDNWLIKFILGLVLVEMQNDFCNHGITLPASYGGCP